MIFFFLFVEARAYAGAGSAVGCYSIFGAGLRGAAAARGAPGAAGAAALPPAVCNSAPQRHLSAAQPASRLRAEAQQMAAPPLPASWLRGGRHLQSQSNASPVAVKSARCIHGQILAPRSSGLFCVWGCARVGDSTEPQAELLDVM